MVTSAPDEPTLAALITRAADHASSRTLLTCAVLGALIALAPWVVRTSPRVLPIAFGICLVAFGVRGLATHALSVDPAVKTLRALARVSVGVGIVSGVVGAFWLFFLLYGSSFWN
jgi:integral membrane sensor domain MASE1